MKVSVVTSHEASGTTERRDHYLKQLRRDMGFAKDGGFLEIDAVAYGTHVEFFVSAVGQVMIKVERTDRKHGWTQYLNFELPIEKEEDRIDTSYPTVINYEVSGDETSE